MLLNLVLNTLGDGAWTESYNDGSRRIVYRREFSDQDDVPAAGLHAVFVSPVVSLDTRGRQGAVVPIAGPAGVPFEPPTRPGRVPKLRNLGPGEILTGTGVAESPKEVLSRMIDLLNQRFHTEFDAQDLIDGVRAQLVADEDMQLAARSNTKENFRYKLDPALEEALVERHAEHGRFIDALYEDPEKLRWFKRRMAEEIYRALRDTG